jgi:hypothetical protein
MHVSEQTALMNRTVSEISSSNSNEKVDDVVVLDNNTTLTTFKIKVQY